MWSGSFNRSCQSFRPTSPGGPIPPETSAPSATRIFRALRELLGAFGECVCVLEDLHWADEGTLRPIGVSAFIDAHP